MFTTDGVPTQPASIFFDKFDRRSIGAVHYNTVDLLSVAIHEMGNVLGLDHTNIQAAVIFPTHPFSVQKHTLDQDDIRGIRAL